MRIRRLRTLSRNLAGCLLAVGLIAGVVVGQPASAQSAWETMHPGSFEGSISVARQQCERTAGQSSRDTLTTAKCDQFQQMLTAGRCEQRTVADGTVFSYMNYRHAGESPSVQGRTEKRLGSNATQATVCDLGDGVTTYWFNEQGVGCNNVAFILPRQTTAAVPPASSPPPAPPRQRVCRLVAVDQGVVYRSERVWHVPGYHTDHSNCGPHIDLPDVSGVTQSTIRSTALVPVCE